MAAETAEARRVRVARQPRDQLAHWVTPASERGKPCPHRCCQSQRPHPGNLPVRLDRAYLRSLSMTDLERELDSYQQYSDTHEAGFLQVIAEVRRRETREAYQGRETARQARRAEAHRDEVYRQWLAAEAATNGFMLNPAGRAAGIDERTLFTTTSDRKVRKYASPELLEYFAAHGRPTRTAYRRGQQRRTLTY